MFIGDRYTGDPGASGYLGLVYLKGLRTNGRGDVFLGSLSSVGSAVSKRLYLLVSLVKCL